MYGLDSGNTGRTLYPSPSGPFAARAAAADRNLRGGISPSLVLPDENDRIDILLATFTVAAAAAAVVVASRILCGTFSSLAVRVTRDCGCDGSSSAGLLGGDRGVLRSLSEGPGLGWLLVGAAVFSPLVVGAVLVLGGRFADGLPALLEDLLEDDETPALDDDDRRFLLRRDDDGAFGDVFDDEADDNDDETTDDRDGLASRRERRSMALIASTREAFDRVMSDS